MCQAQGCARFEGILLLFLLLPLNVDCCGAACVPPHARGVQQCRNRELGGGRGRGERCSCPAWGWQSPGSSPTVASPWGQWGSEPRGGGSEGWHRLRAVPAAGKPLWGQREPLASPVLPWLPPVPVAQADPWPRGVAVTGACSGRGAWLPPPRCFCCCRGTGPPGFELKLASKITLILQRPPPADPAVLAGLSVYIPPALCCTYPSSF